MKTVKPGQYLNSGILEKWHDKTWDDFDNDLAAKKRILKYLSKVEQASQEGVGLYLWGANGVGKTLSMNLAFKDLMAKGYKVHIITLSSLITMFTTSWYDQDQRTALYQRLLLVDFLGIEEIGKEFKSATDLGAVVLDSIVKYRVQRQLPIWATSNVSPSSITSMYTEDIASMLKESCVAIQVMGSDRRDDIKERIKSKYS